MRIFKRMGPQRAQSDDGVSIYSRDRFAIRYELPDRYCDLLDRPFLKDNQVAGLEIAMSGALFEPLCWQLADGSKQQVTAAEMQEIRRDVTTAMDVLNTRVLFVD